MRNLKHLLISALLALSISTLWAGLAFAAADDYTIAGGDLAALPAAGAASVAVNTITLTDAGGDDIGADPETLTVTLNTTDYGHVELDQTVTTLTIAGTCGYTGHNALNYVSSNTVEIPVTGGTSCGAGQTITIAGLKVQTSYAAASPGDVYLLTVDNTTTNPGVPIEGGTIDLAVAVGDLTSTNVEPETLGEGEIGRATVTFTSTANIGKQSQILVTFPSGYDLSNIQPGSNPVDCTGFACSSWTMTVSGQIVTMTEGNVASLTAGTYSFAIDNVMNPTSTGSTGTYTILTKDSSANSVETDASVTADTIEAVSSHASTLVDPSDLTIEDYEEGGVMLTWDDPSGDDSTGIKIYRGIDPYPVTLITTVSTGIEYYVDEGVEEGDVVTYFLRSTDGLNSSNGTDEVTFTVGGGTSDDGTDDDTSDDDGTDDDSSDDDTSDDDGTDDDSSDDDTSDDDTEEPEFSDTEGHWAATEIEYMVSEGVIEGYDDGTFMPSENLNRAEAAALLYRVFMDEDPYEQDEMPFDDVELGEWYTNYIGYLLDYALVSGNPDGTYTPGDDINRAEFLQLAMNVYEYINGEVADVDMTGMFVDLDTDEWYAQVVSNAADMGFVEGSEEEDGTYFNADDEITRAEATVILYRMFGE